MDPKQKLVRTSIQNTGEAFLDAKLRSWKDARNEEGDSRSDGMEVADYVGATHASACTEIYIWRVAAGGTSEDCKGDKGKTKKIEMRKVRSGEEGEEGDAGVREEGGRAGRQAGWPATTRSESQLAAAAAFLFRHLSSY